MGSWLTKSKSQSPYKGLRDVDLAPVLFWSHFALLSLHWPASFQLLPSYCYSLTTTGTLCKLFSGPVPLLRGFVPSLPSDLWLKGQLTEFLSEFQSTCPLPSPPPLHSLPHSVLSHHVSTFNTICTSLTSFLSPSPLPSLPNLPARVEGVLPVCSGFISGSLQYLTQVELSICLIRESYSQFTLMGGGSFYMRLEKWEQFYSYFLMLKWLPYFSLHLHTHYVSINSFTETQHAQL